jgi:hypothetical protein
LQPTGDLKLPFRALDIEVGDPHHVHAGRQPRLREEHCAELPGSDDSNSHRPPGLLALQQ